MLTMGRHPKPLAHELDRQLHVLPEIPIVSEIDLHRGAALPRMKNLEREITLPDPP